MTMENYTLYTVDEKTILHHNAKEIKYFINENDCYNCVSHRLKKKGYPMKHFDGKYTTMSRYIWFLGTGDRLEKQEHVLHKCDNPQCINFEHLFVGSNSDNVKDKMKKKRQARHAKLSIFDVTEIKKNITQTSVELSEFYGVTDSNIRALWNEKTHKYVVIENYEMYQEKRKERIKQMKSSNFNDINQKRGVKK